MTDKLYLSLDDIDTLRDSMIRRGIVDKTQKVRVFVVDTWEDYLEGLQWLHTH